MTVLKSLNGGLTRKTDADPHGNAARALRAGAPSQFVGVDGEGVTEDDGTHRYVLLSCGDSTLHYDGATLCFQDILEFLWAHYLQFPSRVYCGFYLGYDWSQWLRDLPVDRAKYLIDPACVARRQRKLIPHAPPFPVEHGEWEFDWLYGRRFKLRKAGSDCGWMTICDVGSFFQCSFLTAIDPQKATVPVVTQAEYDIIARGKANRAAAKFNPLMVTYNQLECDVLRRLMEQQDEGVRELVGKLSRSQWIGPGQVAQRWLRIIDAPTSEQLHRNAPTAVRDAARCAYFGGWFEIFWHGLVPGKCYGYDINSAYPRAMELLPELRGMKWRHSNRTFQLHGAMDIPATLGPTDYMLVRARVYGSHPVVGAMMHRTGKGAVLRPRETEGWYWWFEIDAARKAGFIDEVEIKEVWVGSALTDRKPIAAIRELYEDRLKIGKNTPAGKARKLVYNSCYGKFAQSIGAPFFGNPIYASMITAMCRTMILDAIRTHPKGAHHLVMVATDGVVFRSKHPGLRLSSQLGDWEETEHDNLSLFMPGVYWDDRARERLSRGDDPQLKSRGISGRDLGKRLATVDRAWGRYSRDGWPRLAIPVEFNLVSPRQALSRGKWQLCGTVSKATRLIYADPFLKRVATKPGRSRPYQRSDPFASTPYDGSFGDDYRALADDEFGVHPDGEVADIIAEQLYGH